MGFGGLGGMELGLIMLVLMLVFGAKRLPELGRGLGRGIREFKDSVSGITGEITDLDRAVRAPAEPGRLSGGAGSGAGAGSGTGGDADTARDGQRS